MLSLGGFDFNRFEQAGERAGVISNYLQSPTPGLDQNYYLSEVSQSNTPGLTADRVIREYGDEKKAMTEFDRQRLLGRREVAGRFSSMRNDLQRGIAFRGMGRSGFAAEKMGQLGAQEGGALAEVEAGRTDAIAAYKRQIEEMRMQRSAERRAKRKAKKKKAIGAALGIAGLALAPVTGGASLLAAGQGANMYASG